MKSIFFTLLLFLVVGVSSAQIKVQGIIKDSIGTPLELANVIAINQETKKLDSYAISNSNGQYLLKLNKNTTYKIQVSFIGMKTAEEIIAIKSDNITKDFSLKEDNTLQEIELKYEMPVTIKGDTIVYNADSFKTGSERKLEDVLKKLPGVEINDNGEIEVEGKKVSKVMLEGKDFFDGDTKLAAKNIPSNAVDKVEILKNFSEVGQLRNVTDNQDNIALNIKLKEGKKNFWFGDITGGGGSTSGDKELYLFQPKLFYHSPKYSINIISDLNNSGEGAALTRKDLRSFSGGFKTPSRQSGTSINLGSNNLSFLALQNSRAQEINNKFGGANFSYSPKKTLDLSGFGIISSSRVNSQESSNIIYVDSDLGRPNEDIESATRQKSDIAVLKLSAQYKPDLNNQLNYDVLAKTGKESEDQDFFSSVNNDIEQLESANPYSINQNLNYYYTLNDKNIFAFEGVHLLQDEDPFYNAILENDPANNNPIDPDDNLPDGDPYDATAQNLGLNRDLNFYNINQKKRVKSNQIDAKLDYWNILNAKSNINFTLGTIYSNQKFNSNIFQFLDNNTTVFQPIPTINEGVGSNDINYVFSDVYLGIRYMLKAGIFTFTPSFSNHFYSVRNTQLGEKTTDNFFRLLPNFNMRIQLKSSEQIGLNYRIQTQFTDVNNFARGLVLNNYDSFFTGVPDLENALSHNVNLSYSSFNMFNYTNVFASVNYNKSINKIRTSSQFETGNVIRIGEPFNSPFSDESISANASFQRRFGKFQVRLNSNFTYSKFNQLINQRQSTNENYIQNYQARIRTNFKAAPNIVFTYRYSINDNDLGAARRTNFTKSPAIELDAYIWKSLTFITNFSYTNFSDEQGTLNDYKDWDASLSYRKNKDSKWEYELKATNLLDNQSQNNTSTGPVSVRTTEFFRQPRLFIFRLKYNL